MTASYTPFTNDAPPPQSKTKIVIDTLLDMLILLAGLAGGAVMCCIVAPIYMALNSIYKAVRWVVRMAGKGTK